MPLSIHDFAGHRVGRGLGFGVSSKATVASLRKLADAIEAKELYVQGARIFGVAMKDDFAITTLRLSFAETVPQPTDEVKKLYSPDSQFPLAAAKT